MYTRPTMTSILSKALSLETIAESSQSFSGCGDDIAEYNLLYNEAEAEFKASIAGLLSDEDFANRKLVRDVATFFIDHILATDTSDEIKAIAKSHGANLR